MRAVQTNLRQFIAESQYFRIPDFQRPYAWNQAQGDSFWESLTNSVTNSKCHYFGSVVFFEEHDNRVVIDGQQRLTTTLLFLTACYHVLLDDSRKSWKYTAAELGKTFLYNEDNGELKVILRGATTDRETFDRILRRNILPIDEQSKLYAMYQSFKDRISLLDKVDSYIDVLDRIDLISILLTPEDDNPQIIFENINATGEPLTDGDKIRNFALMLNSEASRSIVYNDYWLKIEKSLTRSGQYIGVGQQLISVFFRVFLTIKFNDKVINDNNTYQKFKEYYSSATADQSVEKLRETWVDIISILEDFVYLFYGDDNTDGKIFSLFDEDIDDPNEDFTRHCVTRHLTFFIQLLEYYKRGELTRNDFRNILAAVRKQQIRDDLGGDGTLKLINNSANVAYKHFKEYEMRSFFDAYLWYMEGAGDVGRARNISDEEIIFALTNKDMKDKQAKFLLCDLDFAHDNNSHSAFKKVDHIMPKAVYGFKLDDAWKEELGDEWEQINQRFYGKLANMALVSYAPSTNKNLTFSQKIDRYDGLGKSGNYTTQWIAENCERWDLAALKKRTIWLREEIIRLYSLPSALKSIKIKDKFTSHDTVA